MAEPDPGLQTDWLFAAGAGSTALLAPKRNVSALRQQLKDKPNFLTMNDFLGTLAALLAILGTVPYVRDMLRGTTQPHAFTWIIWGTLTAIGCAAQLAGGGGPGSWAAGTSAVCCLFVGAYALVRGERDIVTFDWLSLAGAAVAGAAWALTNNPLWSVVLISLIDLIAYLPTFRKSYSKPWSETISAYLWPFPKHIVSLFALATFTLTTSLYSFVIMGANAAFITYVLVRRRAVTKPTTAGIPLPEPAHAPAGIE